MRVANVDGLVTLFYDGSRELYNQDFEDEFEEADENIFDYLSSEDDEFNDVQQWPNLSNECKEYLKERHSWRQIIVMEGVTVIPEYTFYRCAITRVVFADTVVRIENHAFYDVSLLYDIKLPINLEYIGEEAFFESRFQSVFIPPSCREIGFLAFSGSISLLIFHLPAHTALSWNAMGPTAMGQTKLMQRYASRSIHDESLSSEDWIRTINVGNEYELHRVCCSFQPDIQDILEIVERKGIRAFQEENKIGITPSKYLQENPYTDISEMDFMRRHILNMMDDCMQQSMRAYLFGNECKWIRKYALHRACCSFEPSPNDIIAILQKKGIGAFNQQNDIGVNENSYATLTEKEIIQQYIMDLVWECKIFDETNANSDPTTRKKRLNALEIVCFVGAFINWLYILFFC